jgi:hypothetical protein
MPKPVRVSIWVSTALLDEIERTNVALNKKYGLRLQKADATRMALQAYARNVVSAAEQFDIISPTDIENALSGIGKKKGEEP